MSDGYTVILDVGGLTERWDNVRVPLTERLPFFDVSPSTREVSIALPPRVLDMPAILAAGHDPSDALLRVYDGDDLVFAGRAVGSVRSGRRGDPIRLTASESPWADGTKIPASWTQRVTVIDTAVQSLVQSANRGGIPMSAWGYYEREDLRGDPLSPPIVSALGYDLYTDRAEGRAGPIVFGAPGYQDGESWPATPAYWVDTTADAEQLQIARHRVDCTTVTIYGPCVDGEVRGKVADVSHVRTTEGVEVAVAEIGPLLGRGPVLTLTIGHDVGTVYTFNSFIEYRSLGGAITGGAFNATWVGGANVTATYNAAIAALQAGGFVEPWVTGEVEFAGSTITLTYVISIVRGEYGIPHDINVTTETAVGGTGTLSHTTDHVDGADVAAPTDFRPDVSAEWAVAWTGGEAQPGGAGDVIRYVLDQTRIRVDRDHLDSWRRELNRYTLAGCIDEEVDAAQWLAAQLAWLPIGWTQGRDGLRPWVYDPEAPPVATLDEDLGLDVLGDVGTTEGEPVAQVRIAYRVGEDRPSGRLQTRQQTIWSELARGGKIVEIETDLCDETASAERAAALRQRAYHARHLAVRGQLLRTEWSWLRAGDPVRVVATSRGVQGRGLVIEITDDGGPLLQVELLVWRDGEVAGSTFEDVPVTPPVPAPPSYSSLLGNWTQCTGKIYDAPPGTGSIATIYNRSGAAGVDDLLGSGVSADTGYAPDGATTVGVLSGVDSLIAWLHADTGGGDGPYTMSGGGHIVAKQPLYDSRANGQDLISLMRGGRGTGGAAVIVLTLETRTGDDLVLVAWDGSGTTDIQSWSIPPEIMTGTASKDSWIVAGVRWAPDAGPQPWRVVVVVDLDDGAGPVTLIDDSFTEAASDFGPLTANNVTQVRQTAKGVFMSTLYYHGDSDADFERNLIASLYEVSDLEELP